MVRLKLPRERSISRLIEFEREGVNRRSIERKTTEGAFPPERCCGSGRPTEGLGQLVTQDQTKLWSEAHSFRLYEQASWSYDLWYFVLKQILEWKPAPLNWVWNFGRVEKVTGTLTLLVTFRSAQSLTQGSRMTIMKHICRDVSRCHA